MCVCVYVCLRETHRLINPFSCSQENRPDSSLAIRNSCHKIIVPFVPPSLEHTILPLPFVTPTYSENPFLISLNHVILLLIPEHQFSVNFDKS